MQLQKLYVYEFRVVLPLKSIKTAYIIQTSEFQGYKIKIAITIKYIISFLYPGMPEKVLSRRQIFEMEILMDLHF